MRDFGVSAEPVIDSLQPHIQKIWKSLSSKEKEIFMTRLRYLWGVARHRIPLHILDKIQQLRIDGKLHIQLGRIIDIIETSEHISVQYFDKKENKEKNIKVSRDINCTGPETDLMQVKKSFIEKLLTNRHYYTRQPETWNKNRYRKLSNNRCWRQAA